MGSNGEFSADHANGRIIAATEAVRFNSSFPTMICLRRSFTVFRSHHTVPFR